MSNPERKKRFQPVNAFIVQREKQSPERRASAQWAGLTAEPQPGAHCPEAPPTGVEPHSSLWAVRQVLRLSRQERDSFPRKPLCLRSGLGQGRKNVHPGLLRGKQVRRNLTAGPVRGGLHPRSRELVLKRPWAQSEVPDYWVPTVDQDRWEESEPEGPGRPGWGSNRVSGRVPISGL